MVPTYETHSPACSEGLMHGNFTVSTSNFFFERSLVDEIGPFRPLRRVIDWDWALRAASANATAGAEAGDKFGLHQKVGSQRRV